MTRNGHAGRLPAALGLLELFLLLDAAFNWRWLLHARLVNAAMGENVYSARRFPQELVLGLLAGVTITAMVLAQRYFRGRPGACLSVYGALISAVFWLIEVVSLHATDAILQRPVGPFMLVAYVWAISSLMTAVGILRDAKPRAIG